MSSWSFTEILSQRILVGITFAGRLGVACCGLILLVMIMTMIMELLMINTAVT